MGNRSEVKNIIEGCEENTVHISIHPSIMDAVIGFIPLLNLGYILKNLYERIWYASPRDNVGLVEHLGRLSTYEPKLKAIVGYFYPHTTCLELADSREKMDE